MLKVFFIMRFPACLLLSTGGLTLARQGTNKQKRRRA